MNSTYENDHIEYFIRTAQPEGIHGAHEKSSERRLLLHPTRTDYAIHYLPKLCTRKVGRKKTGSQTLLLALNEEQTITRKSIFYFYQAPSCILNVLEGSRSHV